MPDKKITNLNRLNPMQWYRGDWLRRSFLILCALILLFVGGMYGIARWYIAKHADEPLRIGATFIPRYARYFELDPKETMQAMIDDLGIKYFRLVSYWDDIEPTPGEYNFEELDWQFEKVSQAGGTVSLAIGLRQPRWPECHMPGWAASKAKIEWSRDLKTFMGKVIDRYGDHPALESYQLENEFFMTVFGICPDHSRDRLIDEYNFVKAKDPDTPVIISRSNNWLGIPIGEPRADQFAISVYKRVWDKTFTKRYFEYPLPAWFYATLAGAGEIATGRDMIVHELQAEAWLPEGYAMPSAPEDELYKSLNPERLRDRIAYGEATGMRTITLWGVEWWYHMKEKRDAPELWNAAKDELEKYKN